MNKKDKIRIIITVALFFLFAFANFYTIRRMAHYGVQVYLYDKLLVAYQTGGVSGLNAELERVLKQDKMPRELAEAKAFKSNLVNIKDVNEYLSGVTKHKMDRINLLRNLRILAFVLILLIFLARFILNLSKK
jgi:hypothetical protein